MKSFLFAIRQITNTFILNPYANPRKLFNAIIAFYSYAFSHSSVLRSMPLRLVVDTGNVCNLRCPLCPTGAGNLNRTVTLLSYDRFSRIVDEVGKYLYEIDLYNWGEPFLNPDIYKIISYAHKHRIKTRISSNLNRISNDDCEKIIHSGLDELVVSLDGVDQESYGKYRVGGDFSLVMSNLKRLIELKREEKSANPRIVWQYLVMKHNEEHIERAKSMAEELGVDKLLLRPMRCDMGMEVFLSDSKKVASVENWLPENSEYSRYDYIKKTKKMRPLKCLFLETTMVINPDGSVSPCCGVADQKWDFGNVFNSSFKDVWNNDLYRRARRVVAGKEKSAEDVICSYCVKNGFLEY